MSAPVSRRRILFALLRKEFVAYTRDKLYLFLTLLTLVLIIVFYHLLPDTVDETITLAVSPSIETLARQGTESLRALGVPEDRIAELTEVLRTAEGAGLRLVEFDSAEELSSAIERGDEAQIGIAFPDDFIGRVIANEENLAVTIYSDAGVPEEVQATISGFVREIARQLSGETLPVTFVAEGRIVLGEDRAGEQISMRERMLPMFALMILLMEAFSLASLISVEILRRTISAVLVTPARISDLLAAKTVFGTSLAFVQGMVVLLLVGAITSANWWLLVMVMLIGALLFTSLAMIAGAAGKDFMGQVFYTMFLTVPLLIPAFALLFPGTAATWVTLMPTYPLLDVLVGVTVHDAGWPEVYSSMALAFGWAMALYAVGLAVLKRKAESL